MLTLRFDVPRLRPDYARFDTDAECAGAINNLINKRFAGRSLRILVTNQAGEQVYYFNREMGDDRRYAKRRKST